MENKKNIINTIFTLFIILICFCIVIIPFQNDTFFSIAVGRQIQNTGIDMVEHLTWHENLSYTYSHWLYDVINYKLYSVFGFKGIYFFTVIISILIGITLYNILKRVCKNNILLPFLFTSLIMLLSSVFITSRAQIISYLLFILEVYFIEELLETNKKRYVLGLIIIPLIIANVHAALWPLYFILYMPYLAESFFNRYSIKNWNKKRIKDYEKKLEKESDEKNIELYKNEIKYFEDEMKTVNESDKKVYCKGYKYIKTLIIVGIIAIFTGFCTPIGDTPFTYMFKTMNDGLSSKYIQELKPASIPEDVQFMIFSIILIGIIVSKRVKIRMSDAFMLLGLIVLSFFAKRSLAYLFLIGVIHLLRTTISYFNKNELEKLDKELIKISDNKKVTIGLVIYILFIIIFTYTEINVGKSFVDETSYPVGACEYILENINLNTSRIYNGFDYGSYMEYKGIPVYMDSRSEMYTQAYNNTNVYQDFIDVSKGDLLYNDLVEKYGITHLLLKQDDWLSNYIKVDSNYRVLYEDEYFILFEVIKVSVE